MYQEGLNNVVYITGIPQPCKQVQIQISTEGTKKCIQTMGHFSSRCLNWCVDLVIKIKKKTLQCENLKPQPFQTYTVSKLDFTQFQKEFNFSGRVGLEKISSRNYQDAKMKLHCNWEFISVRSNAMRTRFPVCCYHSLSYVVADRLRERDRERDEMLLRQNQPLG